MELVSWLYGFTETVPSFTAPYLVFYLPFPYKSAILLSRLRMSGVVPTCTVYKSDPFSRLPYTCFDPENVRKLLKSSVSK
jgi:hypothetical protein